MYHRWRSPPLGPHEVSSRSQWPHPAGWIPWPDRVCTVILWPKPSKCAMGQTKITGPAQQGIASTLTTTKHTKAVRRLGTLPPVFFIPRPPLFVLPPPPALPSLPPVSPPPASFICSLSPFLSPPPSLFPSFFFPPLPPPLRFSSSLMVPMAPSFSPPPFRSEFLRHPTLPALLTVVFSSFLISAPSHSFTISRPTFLPVSPLLFGLPHNHPFRPSPLCAPLVSMFATPPFRCPFWLVACFLYQSRIGTGTAVLLAAFINCRAIGALPADGLKRCGARYAQSADLVAVVDGNCSWLPLLLTLHELLGRSIRPGSAVASRLASALIGLDSPRPGWDGVLTAADTRVTRFREPQVVAAEADEPESLLFADPNQPFIGRRSRQIMNLTAKNRDGRFVGFHQPYAAEDAVIAVLARTFVHVIV